MGGRGSVVVFFVFVEVFVLIELEVSGEETTGADLGAEQSGPGVIRAVIAESLVADAALHQLNGDAAGATDAAFRSSGVFGRKRIFCVVQPVQSKTRRQKPENCLSGFWFLVSGFPRAV
jgi:hypothetical protein